MKNILLVLDSGDSARLARNHALQLAQQHQAALTALALIDAAPLREGEAMPPGGYAYRAARDASLEQRWLAQAQQQLDEVAAQAALLAVSMSALVAEDVQPEAALTHYAPGHDLLVVTAASHLGDSEREHDMRWLENYLLNPARPLLLFSPQVRVLPAGHCVALAYDGSPCAARALQQFVFLGLEPGLPCKVLVSHADDNEAERLAAEACAYLALHGREAQPVLLEARFSNGQLLLDEADRHGASLLVMGAFGHNSWKARLFGSTTRMLMQQSHVPLLMFH